MQPLRPPGPAHRIVFGAVALAMLAGACSGTVDDEGLAEALGISTTSAAPPTTVAPTVTTQTPGSTSSTLPLDVVVNRIEAGDLAPTRYGTSEFAFGLTFDLPNGAWSTDIETRNVIHLAQSPEPDFAAAIAYDFPLLVLLALPQLDESAVIDIVQNLEDIGFTTATETTVDGRPTVLADGASRTNPRIDAFETEDQTAFAALGGYWYWDPDVKALRYRVWIIDIGRGTLLAWYAAPRSAFDANADQATEVVESIRFTD